MAEKKLKKTSFIQFETEVLGGKASVIKTSQAGDVYQFRMWVNEEKKYVRKSLFTKDLDTAIQRAENKYLDLYSDIRSGKKLFGIKLKEVVDLYLDYRKEDVEVGNITEGRLNTIKTQMKHLLNYKNANTKMAELDTMSCYEYANWCRANRVNVRDVTIRNEQAIINNLIRFAYRKGYCHFQSFEFRTIKVRKDENSRRGTFTLEQYDDLCRAMRTWSSKKQCGEDEKLRNERLLVRDCILIASNTMLRVGELWQLKWKDIEKIELAYDAEEKEYQLVTINVRAETSKTRTARRIVARGGEYFRRLKERSEFTDDNDYVFSGDRGNKIISRQKLYKSWQELMEMIGIDYVTEKITWYSLRHFGITCRLRAGCSIYDVAKVAGTGTVFIDQHYGHFDDSMSKSMALRNFTFDQSGIIEK